MDHIFSAHFKRKMGQDQWLYINKPPSKIAKPRLTDIVHFDPLRIVVNLMILKLVC